MLDKTILINLIELLKIPKVNISDNILLGFFPKSVSSGILRTIYEHKCGFLNKYLYNFVIFFESFLFNFLFSSKVGSVGKQLVRGKNNFFGVKIKEGISNFCLKKSVISIYMFS